MPIGQATLLGRIVVDAPETNFVFPELMGFVELKNDGPNSVWLTLDGTTVPTPGVTQDGQFELKPQAQVTLEGVALLRPIGKCVSGQTAAVQVTGTPT